MPQWLGCSAGISATIGRIIARETSASRQKREAHYRGSETPVHRSAVWCTGVLKGRGGGGLLGDRKFQCESTRFFFNNFLNFFFLTISSGR